MTRREQARFLRELTGNVRSEMLAHVKAGRVPDDWDDIELRWWIADWFARCQFPRAGSIQRLRNYHHDIVEENLL